MFDIGASEFLLIIIVAIVVIGPKDMPMALRTAGRWIGRIRQVSGHFRSGIETMIREAELEEMEKKWRDQNAAIMQLPAGETDGTHHPASAEAALTATPAVSAAAGAASLPPLPAPSPEPATAAPPSSPAPPP